MRIALDLNEALVAEAKTVAAREHTTLARLVEEGLALRIRQAAAPGGPKSLRSAVYHGRGGLSPDIADSLTNRALLDAAEEDGSA